MPLYFVQIKPGFCRDLKQVLRESLSWVMCRHQPVKANYSGSLNCHSNVVLHHSGDAVGMIGVHMAGNGLSERCNRV